MLLNQSAVFDTVDHFALLIYLQNGFRISGAVLYWFQVFLWIKESSHWRFNILWIWCSPKSCFSPMLFNSYVRPVWMRYPVFWSLILSICWHSAILLSDQATRWCILSTEKVFRGHDWENKLKLNPEMMKISLVQRQAYPNWRSKNYRSLPFFIEKQIVVVVVGLFQSVCVFPC